MIKIAQFFQKLIHRNEIRHRAEMLGHLNIAMQEIDRAMEAVGKIPSAEDTKRKNIEDMKTGGIEGQIKVKGRLILKKRENKP